MIGDIFNIYTHTSFWIKIYKTKFDKQYTLTNFSPEAHHMLAQLTKRLNFLFFIFLFFIFMKMSNAEVSIRKVVKETVIL